MVAAKSPEILGVEDFTTTSSTDRESTAMKDPTCKMTFSLKGQQNSKKANMLLYSSDFRQVQLTIGYVVGGA